MLSLPLAKLSVALDTDPDAQSFTWQHETHDLTFVIDSYGGSGSSQLLKVVQAANIGYCSLSSSSYPLATAQPKGRKKSSFLEIHTYSHITKVRRAQIKFKSNQDYDAAYSQLDQLGLRMTPSNDTQANARPYTPSSARGLPVKHNVTATTYPHQALPGGLSCPPSHLADIASRPYSASDASVPTHTRLQDVAHSRPFSALAGYNSADSTIPGLSSSPLTPPVYFARPSSATTELLQQSSTNAGFPPRDSFTSSLEEASRHNTTRLDASPPSSSSHSAEASLPPRRELPFQRSSAPRSSGSDTIQPSSRSSTSLMGPPPLPVRVTNLRPSSARDGAMETDRLQSAQPTLLAEPESRLQAAQKPPRTPDASKDMHSGIDSFAHQDKGSQRPSNFSPIHSSSPGSSPSFPRRSETVFPPGNTLQGPRRAASLNTSTPPRSFDNMLNTHLAPSTSQACQADDVHGLRGYAMQSEDGRRAALNEFIFRHLENDDFLTLVEDMETCWARAALGMR
ncbi:hypothetical protein IAQ61_011259 [Plenodomus lingam]|uniref:uncharacterized protein n=1 Tax=Leptosphaeria maculans TaxID=5022 RepID=UPI00331E8956|nr:hypothetical protein IAQ61_011259 [Plenodomus lingam]